MKRSWQNLTPRRVLVIAFILALGLPTAISLLTGCENTPSAPEYANPFDPLGPDGGDPLQLRAEAINDTTINLTWNQPQGLGITKYIISYSAYRDSNYEEKDTKEQTANPTTSYPFSLDPQDATTTLWFRIQAFTPTQYSITSYATPTGATSGPRVIVGPGKGKTATRYPDIEVTVTQGDEIQVALDWTFTDSLRVIPAGTPGEAQILAAYDLGPATANNQTRTIYVQSVGTGYASALTQQNLGIDFNPAFKVKGNPPTLATRTVDLTVPTTGVVQMRFFADWADSAATPWVAAADTFFGYQLSDNANPQFIRAQFLSDFGFVDDQELQVTPDLLTSATFKLAWPDSNSVVDQSTVLGISKAVATQMRYSETADFTNSPWIAYRDTAQIVLSPTPGLKVVYVQYRNDWTMSGTLTDYIVHVTQPAEVDFWAPVEGSVVEGGTQFQVRGGAFAGLATDDLYLVEFDGGDGNGFVDATGTETWSAMWTVPRFTQDTPLIIRAQAWYGPAPDSLESVTTAITVTVTQLAVAITAPTNGADLLGNKKTAFTGTVSGVLGGDTPDYLTLAIGDTLLEKSGNIANWTFEWVPPLWESDSTLTATATAWAGGDTATTSIEVNVIRPPLAITSPRPGQLVSGNADLIIEGITYPDLFAAPVDSVILDIKWGADFETRIFADGTDSWAGVWTTPADSVNTNATIVATALAGAATVSDTVTVVVKPSVVNP